MAKKHITIRLDEHIINEIMGLVPPNTSRTEAIEKRLKKGIKKRVTQL